MNIPRAMALLLPFVIIAWVEWVRSMQIARHNAPRTSLAARDTRLARLGASRSAKLRRRSATVQPALIAPAGEPLPTAAAVERAAVPARGCPASRKPYHTVLTATAQVYQQWQCRIMYHHWKKQRSLDPKGGCTELTGFTRLVASQGGEPDGLEAEIPSYFTKEYGYRDLGNRFHGYRVINRPHSVVQLLASEYWKSAIREDYVYIAETDHILVQPLPNFASRGSPMAYVFNYMGPNPAHRAIVQKAWPAGGEGGWRKVQSIGPSPVLLHRTDLEAIAKPWNDIAVALKTDPQADAALGWVIEMWGYAIAAASLALKHQEFADFQIEPGALSTANQLRGFPSRYWVFHYTYQFEYMLDGTACIPWMIGEYSLDKRHFSDAYPVYPLPEPPASSNAAAFFLLRAFNEAMANISSWPRQPAAPSLSSPTKQTLYGRRRLDWFGRHANGFATELSTMPLIQALAGTVWSCAPAGRDAKPVSLELKGDGNAVGGQQTGRWGSMNDPSLGEVCPVGRCLYIDGAPHRGQQTEALVSSANDESPLSLAVYAHASLGKGAPEVLFNCKRQ